MRVLIIILLTSVIKLSNAQSPAFLWAEKFAGQSTLAKGNSIKTDVLGNIYTTGHFSGIVDFNPGAGTFTINSVPSLNNDIYISKLDIDGNYIWAKAFGGIGNETGLSIAVDLFGNVYACGIFSITADFDPGPGSFSLTSNGGYDAFILKLDPSGNFLWAKSFGGSSHDYANNLTLGANDNLHVCGSFVGTVDFDPGVGTYNLTGPDDAFILKLDKDGNFIWAKNIGGTVGASARALSLDGTGNIFITGPYAGTVDFDPGASTYILNSVATTLDAFVLKLDPSGNFIWARSLGGSSDEVAYGIALDVSGNAHTTGFFAGDADFDPGAGTFSLSASTIRSHIYVSKLDANGNFVWAKGFVGNGAGGSPKNNIGHSIAVDGSGNVFTTGEFEGNVDFDPGASSFILSSNITHDIFISKLNANGNYIWAGRIGSANEDSGNSITLDSFGSIYCTGDFDGIADFDPDAGIYNLTNGGSFILKMAPCCAGFEEYDQNKKFISVYPNPNRGEFSTVVPEEEKNVRVVLYNLMGQIIFTQSLSAGINTIQTKLSKGLYLARLQGDTFTSEAAKVIVE